MNLPMPGRERRWALFLDLDGTLAELAARPDEARVPAAQVARLARIERHLGGALAVISGRSIDSIDRLLAPLRPRAAGLHGLERRNGEHASRPAADRALDGVRRELHAFAGAHPGLLVEDKGPTLALHCRGAPHLEAACRDRAAAAAQALPAHHVLAGKMVFEIKPRHVDKGAAIDGFLGEAPFRGCLPVYAGDDVTDEDGFRRVNALGGVSIKVGDGDTAARARVPGVSALHAWLAEVEDRLAGTG